LESTTESEVSELCLLEEATESDVAEVSAVGDEKQAQADTCKWVMTTSLEQDLKAKEAQSNGGLCGRFVPSISTSNPNK